MSQQFVQDLQKQIDEISKLPNNVAKIQQILALREIIESLIAIEKAKRQEKR